MNSRCSGDGFGGGLEPPLKIFSAGQALVPDHQTSAAKRGSATDCSITSSFMPEGSLLNTPENQKVGSSISGEALSIARKTFKSMEMGSGAIPVVGSYIGAAAKVGLAFVETLQVTHAVSIVLFLILT